MELILNVKCTSKHTCVYNKGKNYPLAKFIQYCSSGFTNI